MQIQDSSLIINFLMQKFQFQSPTEILKWFWIFAYYSYLTYFTYYTSRKIVVSDVYRLLAVISWQETEKSAF